MWEKAFVAIRSGKVLIGSDSSDGDAHLTDDCAQVKRDEVDDDGGDGDDDDDDDRDVDVETPHKLA